MNNANTLTPNGISDYIKKDLEANRALDPKQGLQVKQDVQANQVLEAKQDVDVKQDLDIKVTWKPPIQQQDPTDENWKDHIKNSTISPDKNYTQSAYGIDRLEKNAQVNKVVISEGLTVITAKPKTAKTKMALLFIASALMSGIFNGIFLSSLSEEKKEVSLIDTEQSNYDIAGSYKTLQTLLGVSGIIGKLTLISLRNFNCQQRLFLLQKYLYGNRHIGLLVIDGIRDFVSDPNSADEANKIVSLLLKWATELSLAIVVVIHQNKVDNNVRGHLGTELVNKAHTVLSIEKDGDKFVVSPIVTRYKSGSPWAFRIDEVGTPILIQDFDGGNSTKVKFQHEEQPIEFHREILKEAMSIGKKDPGWSDLKSALRQCFMKRKQDIGDNKLRDLIGFYLQSKLLSKEPIPGRSYDAYRITP